MREHLHVVERTARVLVEGELETARDVWFVLHGYAQAAEEMLAACVPLASPERALVAPEGLSRFYRRGSSGPIGASWMTRDLREAEIHDYVGYLDSVAAWVARSSRATTRSVLGFSQGAATAWRWASTGRTHFDVAIGWGGGFPPEFETSEARDRLAKTELITVRGRGDGYHTAEWLERDRTLAAAQKLRLRILEFDGGHVLDEIALRRVVELARGDDDAAAR